MWSLVHGPSFRVSFALIALAFHVACSAGSDVTVAADDVDSESSDVPYSDSSPEEVSTAASIQVLPDPVDFGPLGLGETAAITVTLKATGAVTVVLDAPVVVPADGAATDHVPAVSIVDGWSGPRTVAPGEELRFELVFAPVSLVAVNGPIAALQVKVAGGAPLTIPILAEFAFAVAQLSPSPVIIAPVAPLSTAVTPLTLRNRGNRPLDVASVTLSASSDDVFSLGAVPAMTIEPGDAITFDLVTTMPEGDAGEEFNGEIVVAGNLGGGELRVPVQAWREFSGHCDPVLVTPSLDFGLVPIGAEVTKTMTVKNKGLWPCSFGYVRISKQISGEMVPAECPVSFGTVVTSSDFKVLSLPPAVKDGVPSGGTVSFDVVFRADSSFLATSGSPLAERWWTSASLQVLFFDSSLPTDAGPTLVAVPPGDAGETAPCNLNGERARPWTVSSSAAPTPLGKLLPPTAVGCPSMTTITIAANPILAESILPLCDIVLDGDCGEGTSIVAKTGLSSCQAGEPPAPGPFTVDVRLAPTEGDRASTGCSLKLISSPSDLPESFIPLSVPDPWLEEWFVDPRPGYVVIAADPLVTAAEKQLVEAELIALSSVLAGVAADLTVYVETPWETVALEDPAAILGLPDLILAYPFSAEDDVTGTITDGYMDTVDAGLLLLRFGDDANSEEDLGFLAENQVFVVSGGLDGCTIATESVPAAPGTLAAVAPERQVDLCQPGWGAVVGALLEEAIFTPKLSYKLYNSHETAGYEPALIMADGPCESGWTILASTFDLVFDPEGPCLPEPGEEFSLVYTPICAP